jgi:hypothetical protein
MCDKCRIANLSVSYGIPNEPYDICTKCYKEGHEYIMSQKYDLPYEKLKKTGGTRRGMNIRSYRRSSRK